MPLKPSERIRLRLREWWWKLNGKSPGYGLGTNPFSEAILRRKSPDKLLGAYARGDAYPSIRHPDCPNCGTELDLIQGRNGLECNSCGYYTG